MLDPHTKTLEQANNELEQTFERMSRNCEIALEILQDIELNDLGPETREWLCGQIHTLREMVRILSSDFEKKLMVEMKRLGRGLSIDDVRSVLYGIAEL